MSDLPNHFDRQDFAKIQRLGQLCSEAGGRAFLVGGCVRSGLLKEQVNDFDIEVFGLSPERLESVLGQLGGSIKVGRAFGIYKLEGSEIDVGLPRRERKTGVGHRGFEVDIDPGMSLVDASRRRDFTLNAIYYDIAADRLEDPLNGIKDLCDRILRHCSGRFTEDPLRVLRAMQLSARIPADVAAETIELCRSLDPGELSRERFALEWEKLLLLGKQPSRGLRFLLNCGWTAFFPELDALIGCPQDPQWHPEGDVWTHTLHCLDAFADRRTCQREEDLVVGLAVLCHDFGKPATTEESGGRIRSPGHEKAGLKPARSFMQRLNIPGRFIEDVLPLVKCHMRPTELHCQRSSTAAVRRLARDCGRLDRLLRVVQADAAGRPPLDSDVDAAIRWVADTARELQVERNAPTSLLKGRDLLKRGWKAGPEVGRFLRKAYEHQLDGEFTTREEALKWLDRQNAG